jgi:hypothetical protein
MRILVVEDSNRLRQTVVRTGPRPQGLAHSILVAQPHRYLGVADFRRSEAAAAAGY